MQPQSQARCLYIGGSVMVVVFATLMGVFQPIYTSVVDGVLVLKDGKPIMESFITPPVPVFMSFRFFNVKNPLQVKYYQAKPQLEEVGPYVYQEIRTKFDIVFDDAGETVSYLQNKSFIFRSDLSEGHRETDKITTINVVMAMVAALGKDIKKLTYIWPEIERTMNVFETHTVSELLFQGWDLPIFDLDFSHSHIPGLYKYNITGTLPEIMRHFNMTVPEALSENKIGYYSTMNNTNDGLYKVSTGKSDISDLTSVLEYDGAGALSWWDDKYCDMINGSDGSQFPPGMVDETTTVWLFVRELCRSMYLEYTHTVDHFGVQLLRFVAPDDLMQAPRFNPDNACYCSSMNCLGSSLLEMTPCMHIPVVMSTPHFYQGDGDELAKYDGLQPVKELHETFLDIEPTLGVPMQAHKRMQLNVPLMPYGKLTSFLNFKTMYFPVFWADEYVDMSESETAVVDKVLTLPFTIVYAVGGVLLAMGVVMVIVGIRKRSKLNNRQNV